MSMSVVILNFEIDDENCVRMIPKFNACYFKCKKSSWVFFISTELQAGCWHEMTDTNITHKSIKTYYKHSFLPKYHTLVIVPPKMLHLISHTGEPKATMLVQMPRVPIMVFNERSGRTSFDGTFTQTWTHKLRVEDYLHTFYLLKLATTKDVAVTILKKYISQVWVSNQKICVVGAPCHQKRITMTPHCRVTSHSYSFANCDLSSLLFSDI